LFEQTAPHLEPIMLDSLPSCLRREVNCFIYRDAISKIALFQGSCDLSGLPEGTTPRWFVAWAMRLLEPQAAAKGDDILRAENNGTAHEVFFVVQGECEAYSTRQLTDRDSDSGDSIEALAETRSPNRSPLPIPVQPVVVPSPTRSPTRTTDPEIASVNAVSNEVEKIPSSSHKRPTVLMVFGPGCTFGLERHLDRRLRYKVRCCLESNCFLYVLSQTAVSEVALKFPDMAYAVRVAAISATLRQMKARVQDYNMARRRRQRDPGSPVRPAGPPVNLMPLVPTEPPPP